MSDERRVIVEGIAAIAVSVAEMGGSEDDMRAAVADMLPKLGELRPDVVNAAAAVIARFPQPLDESPEEIEAARPIRQRLGLPDASDELAASLRAREWLQRMAEDLRSASG